MRVDVFLLTFLAASTLTSGAPSPKESEVGSRLGEQDGGAAAAALAAAAAAAAASNSPQQIYQKRLQSNAPPLPANSIRQPGVQGSDGNVYIAVSKWTLEMLYDFINRLYEKLKAIVGGYEGGGGVGGGMTQYPPQGIDSTRITNEDLRNLYSVLYVIYSLIQDNPLTATNANVAQASMNQQQQQQQQQQQSPMPFGGQPTHIPAENFYSQFGAGANPLAFASAAASSKVSNNRKRSFGSQASDIIKPPQRDVFRKVARKTVEHILNKLDVMLAKKELEELKEKKKKEKEAGGSVEDEKDTKLEILDETKPSTDALVTTTDGDTTLETVKEVAAAEKKAKKA